MGLPDSVPHGMRRLNTERDPHMARAALKEHLARPEAVIFLLRGGMHLPTVQIRNAAAVNFLTVELDLREATEGPTRTSARFRNRTTGRPRWRSDAAHPCRLRSRTSSLVRP
jgi:hypothetical protein